MYGLALGGGGSRGSYEIGVLKGLKEMNIEIGAITGTSIGAINGASYLMGDVSLMEEMWKTLNRDSLIKFKGMNIPDIIRNRGFDFELLYKLIEDNLVEDIIRRNPIDLGIVTYNVTSREPLVLFKSDIPEGKLIDYVAASANHPSFQRLVIDGEEFIDGAVYDNIPIKPLYDRGFREIIAVNLHTFSDPKSLEGPYHLTQIHSDIPLGSILFPDPITIEKNIQMGYLDTLKAFKKLHGNRYYFRSLDDFSLLSSLTAEEVKLLREEMNPIFLNKTLERYQRDHLPEYSMTLAALEITAEVLNIDNMRIYAHQGELFDEIFSSADAIIKGENKIPLKEKIVFKDLDPKAFKALEITAPKVAIANLFLKIIQNRMIGE